MKDRWERYNLLFRMADKFLSANQVISNKEEVIGVYDALSKLASTGTRFEQAKLYRVARLLAFGASDCATQEYCDFEQKHWCFVLAEKIAGRLCNLSIDHPHLQAVVSALRQYVDDGELEKLKSAIKQFDKSLWPGDDLGQEFIREIYEVKRLRP